MTIMESQDGHTNEWTICSLSRNSSLFSRCSSLLSDTFLSRKVLTCKKEYVKKGGGDKGNQMKIGIASSFGFIRYVVRAITFKVGQTQKGNLILEMNIWYCVGPLSIYVSSGKRITPLLIFIYAKSFFTSSVKLVNWSIWIFIDITLWQSCTIVTFCHRDSCQVVRIFDEFNPPWFNPIRETAHIEYLMYEIRCRRYYILRGFSRVQTCTCKNVRRTSSYSNSIRKGKQFTKKYPFMK